MTADMGTEELQALFAETNYRLRESRKAVLLRYGVGTEAELLMKIALASVAGHPAYKLYLSALILEQTRMQIRAEMLSQLTGGAQTALPSISVHLGLKEKLNAHYKSRLLEPARMAEDALLISFDTGLVVEARYFSRQEYSVMWTCRERRLRIDTAPTQSGGAASPPHLHRGESTPVAPPATLPDTDCWLHLSALLNLLLQDPLLEAARTAPAAATIAVADYALIFNPRGTPS